MKEFQRDQNRTQQMGKNDAGRLGYRGNNLEERTDWEHQGGRREGQSSQQNWNQEDRDQGSRWGQEGQSQWGQGNQGGRWGQDRTFSSKILNCLKTIT